MAYTRDFDAKYNDTTSKFEDDRTERAKPRFWMEDVYNHTTKGLDKVEMVEIRVAGEDKNVWAGRVTDDHRRRFANQYRAFKNNEELPVNGTPLSNLAGMNYQLEQTLKFMGFASIEELARATEQACTQFMSGYAWRKKAQIYVEQNTAKVSLDSQKDSIIAQQSEMLRHLQEQMAEMSAKMAASAAEPVKKKPGPKPKAAPVEAAA